jgi:hypothetical protein
MLHTLQQRPLLFSAVILCHDLRDLRMAASSKSPSSMMKSSESESSLRLLRGLRPTHQPYSSALVEITL